MLFYRALLRLYPKSFRAEYGAEMMKDFDRDWRDASIGGEGRAPRRAPLRTRWSTPRACTATSRSRICVTRFDRCGARPDSRSPRLSSRHSALAPPPRRSRSPITCCCGRCRSPSPIALVRLWEDHSSRGYPRMEPSPPNFLDWQRMATVFERLEPFTGGSASLVGHGEPEQVNGASVGGGVFQLLRRPAALGRVLTESDVNAAEGERPIVISDRIWRTRFGASPDVLGQTISLDDRAYVIVGVMPPDFYFPSRNRDFWRTLRLGTTESDNDRGNHYLAVIGRLEGRRLDRGCPRGDGPDRRPARAGLSESARGERRDARPVARADHRAATGVAARPGWRVDLRVADRVHQSRQPVDVARAGAPIRIRHSRRDRRQRRSAGAADADRQLRARRLRRSAGHCPRGRGGAAARAPGSNQPADRRGAAHRSADARRHVAGHRRRRHRVWPVAGTSRLPQDRRIRAQGWRARRHEPRH